MPGYIDSDEFIAAFALRERRALDAFFDTYWPRMYAFAYKLIGHGGIAEEVASNAFFKLFTWHEQFASLPNIVTFLYTIVRNDSLNAIAKRKKTFEIEKRYATFHESLVADDEGLRNAVIDGQVMSAIYDIVATMPADMAKVMQLIYGQGKKYRDVSRILGITEDTVNSRRRAGIKFVRDNLFSRQPALPAYLSLSLIIILYCFIS